MVVFGPCSTYIQQQQQHCNNVTNNKQRSTSSLTPSTTMINQDNPLFGRVVPRMRWSNNTRQQRRRDHMRARRHSSRLILSSSCGRGSGHARLMRSMTGRNSRLVNWHHSLMRVGTGRGVPQGGGSQNQIVHPTAMLTQQNLENEANNRAASLTSSISYEQYMLQNVERENQELRRVCHEFKLKNKQMRERMLKERKRLQALVVQCAMKSLEKEDQIDLERQQNDTNLMNIAQRIVQLQSSMIEKETKLTKLLHAKNAEIQRLRRKRKFERLLKRQEAMDYENKENVDVSDPKIALRSDIILGTSSYSNLKRQFYSARGGNTDKTGGSTDIGNNNIEAMISNLKRENNLSVIRTTSAKETSRGQETVSTVEDFRKIDFGGAASSLNATTLSDVSSSSSDEGFNDGGSSPTSSTLNLVAKQPNSEQYQKQQSLIILPTPVFSTPSVTTTNHRSVMRPTAVKARSLMHKKVKEQAAESVTRDTKIINDGNIKEDDEDSTTVATPLSSPTKRKHTEDITEIRTNIVLSPKSGRERSSLTYWYGPYV